MDITSLTAALPVGIDPRRAHTAHVFYGVTDQLNGIVYPIHFRNLRRRRHHGGMDGFNLSIGKLGDRQ